MDSPPNFNLGIEDSPDQQDPQPPEAPPQPEEAPPQNNPPITEICCVGAGRLGVISMLVMASHCPNVNITVVDNNDAKIDAWNDPDELFGGRLKFPIFEPGLQQLYEQVMPTHRLTFSTDLNTNLAKAEIIFIAVEINTLSKPANKKGRMEVTAWDKVFRILRDIIGIEHKTIVTLSTVPLNFKSLLKEIFVENLGQFKFLLNPSFLREGKAIRDTQRPPQVLIAYDHDHDIDDPTLNQLMENLGVNIIRNLYLQWVDEANIHIVNGFASATLGKLTINGFLGTLISYMNTITLVCNSNSSENADIDIVYDILRRDPRYRNPNVVNPNHGNPNVVNPNQVNHYVFNPKSSVGFGGGLLKDISYLSFVASSSNLPEAADFLKGILKVNEGIRKRFVKTMRLKMNSLRGKKFAILGFTYKSNTENINNSPAIGICQELLREEGATEVKIYDPQAKEADIKLCFPRPSERDRVKVRSSTIAACFQVDAIVVLTDWPEFLVVNYTNIHASMAEASSKDIFIGRDMDGFPNLAHIGFRVHHIKTMNHNVAN